MKSWNRSAPVARSHHHNHHQQDPSQSHPYASPAPGAVPVVSEQDEGDEEECPVCLEPLSFSFRLPGEKPHVVPECGHALHQACFESVYGPLPTRAQNLAAGRKPNASLGVCGVCRRPMRVGEGDSQAGKSNKLAALTGMGERSSNGAMYPGRDTPTGNYPRGSAPMPQKVQERGPNDDDPLERPGTSLRSAGHHSNGKESTYIVTPSIQARAEFPTIVRNNPAANTNSDSNSMSSRGGGGGPIQPLTCIVVVELPSRRDPNLSLPGTGQPQQNRVGNHAYSGLQQQSSSHSLQDAYRSRGGSERTSPTNGNHGPQISPQHSQPPPVINGDPRDRPVSPSMHSQASVSPTRSSTSSPIGGREPEDEDLPPADDPWRATIEDLRSRIIDWKGHSLDNLGPLQLYDHLHVRRDHLLREFFVYLFKEALICVIEEKKRSFARLLPSAASGSENSSVPTKGVLRLKGRIFVRHIRRVTDSSVMGELSLTIDMEDEKLDSFILIFKERSSLETWKNKISHLVRIIREGDTRRGDIGRRGTVSSTASDTRSAAGTTLEEFGGNLPPGVSGKAARMLSGASGLTTGGASSSGRTEGSGARGTISSTSSYGGGGGGGYTMPSKYGGGMRMIEEDSGYGEGGHNSPQTPYSPHSGSVGSFPGAAPAPHSPNTHLVAPHITHGPSNNLPTLTHSPLDILLILSVPPPAAPRSTAGLKIRVLKTTLDFVLASLGERDRISIVTFEIGIGGRVRKTPFLRTGGEGGVRLARFVDSIGEYYDENSPNGPSSPRDEWEVKTGKDEKTDVVTAVNHGLDVVLQRKQKNPISSILLVSDAADSARRAQMDLVLARAEAANIAIHSFGYGRSHDPASLWLMSNHTSGTYTFVKEWYDLRDCLAGCLGGLMSVALLNTKLHLKVVDTGRFKIRKISGVGNSILSSDGRDVDVDLGELRYGEKKEMLVELDLDNSEDLARMQRNFIGGAMSMNGGRSVRAMDGTEQFMSRMGLGMDSLTLQESTGDLMDGMMDRMIDEVPVFELDGSYYDPAAMKNISRLAHPVLLTVTLLPPTSTNKQAASGSDPVIVRRRMELFASDMITRALVLVSKKQYPQGQKILFDTRRILTTALQNITQGFVPTGQSGRNRKELLILQAVRTLQSIQQDVQVLAEALDENVDTFAFDQRNFGAQQAMILRDQKCWSGRTATERLFFSVDNAIELVARSTDWVSTRD